MMNHKIQPFFSIVTAIFLIVICGSCGEETVSGPTQISLSNISLYELLPANTNVGQLSTDIDDATTSFRFVSGEGDTNNSDFLIKGNILQTQKILSYTDGAERSLRIQANDGMVTYEQMLTITLKQFVGTYPSISSPSFANNQQMPREFGADHGNVSPDLDILDVPTSTSSMVLTMTDLDDGNGFHWTVWNIPTNKIKIARNEPWNGTSAVIGENNYGTTATYTGPFPPTEHRYQLTVYFLDGTLNLTAAEFQTLIPSMTGKIIAQTSMIGKYKP